MHDNIYFSRTYIILILLLLSSCRSGYDGPVSDHFDGDEFFNPWDRQERSIWEILRWKITGNIAEWPESVSNPHPPLEPPSQYAEGNVAITFVNHATFLISINGYNILTDPLWSQRTSPVSWYGPKRVREPAIPFNSLPKINAVVISHNHYDHLDIDFLKKISARDTPDIFVPLGDRKWLVQEGLVNISEMDWWDKTESSPEITLHFVPAQHWSARSLLDRNRSLWGGYVIQFNDKEIYVAGDTGYGPHFSMIAKRFKNIEVALLPIGAYEPRWFMRHHHMNPSDAVLAFNDLNAHYALGKHFGCVQLTDEAIDAPVKELEEIVTRWPNLKSRFLAPKHGTTYHYRL